MGFVFNCCCCFFRPLFCLFSFCFSFFSLVVEFVYFLIVRMCVHMYVHGWCVCVWVLYVCVYLHNLQLI